MKTQTENSEKKQAYIKISRLFITACVLVSIIAGWVIGSFTTQVFSQSGLNRTDCNEGNTLLSIPINGEKLPTIMLREFSIIADQNSNR